MPIDYAVTKNRRAHVHRDVRIFPTLDCLPFACGLRQRVSVSALSCSGDNEMSARPEWSCDVLMPLVGKQYRPQFFAGFSFNTDYRALGHTHNLRAAAGLNYYRRSVAGTKSAPLPFCCSGAGIESENLSAVKVAADLDHQASIDEEW